MKLKKLFSITLLLCLLISNIGMSFATDTVKTENLTSSNDVKNYIVKSFPGFDSWNNGKAEFFDVIYDYQGNKIQNLHLIKNGNRTIGYVFTSLDNSKIIEFSLGESVFEGYLKKHFDTKSTSLERSNNEIKLIKSSIIPAYTTNNFQTIIDFTRDDSVTNYRTSSSPINESISKRSNFTNQRIISGVPYYENDGNTPGCGPVSGMNLIGYWDKNGYGNLIKSESDEYIYSLLYHYMGTFKVPNKDAYATSPYGPYTDGLKEYFSTHGYSLSTSSDFSISSSDYEKVIKSEVNDDRPGSVLYHEDYDGVSQYGLHYTTFVGYATDIVDERYYIIHDLWSTNNIYRSWDADYSEDIWALFKVRPR